MNILGWLTGGIIGQFTGPLERAYEAKLNAQSNEDKLEADMTITRIEAARDIAVTEAAFRFSATSLGRYFIVVPFGMWWSSIYIVQIINGLFGTGLVIIDVPPHIHDMALVLIPAIVIADAGALTARRFGRK